jgi:hypothetical protein
MGANSYVAVGNVEDMSNIITNISPSETPIMSAAGRGKAVGVFHTWLEDELGAPGANTQPEGGPLLAVDPEPRAMFGNWTQILERGYQVTGTQEVVAKHGVKSELGYQMQKCAKELALDHEWALINNGAGTGGTVGDKTRKFTSLPAWIVTNEVAAGGPLTEALLNQAVQEAWQAGGNPKRAYMSASNKRVASTFSNPDRQVSQSEKRLTRVITFYESDFGVIELLPHRLMPDNMVIVIDPTYVKMADLRPVHRETIAKTHDSVNGVLLGETTLEVRAEKAHAKITGVTVA